MKTKIIPEMGIEIEEKIHHKEKIYAECEKDCPKGWEISTYEILQKLRNSKYIDKLNLRKTWEFVQNPDNISKEKGYVARFNAYSDGVLLSCDGSPRGSGSALGGRYWRKIK